VKCFFRNFVGDATALAATAKLPELKRAAVLRAPPTVTLISKLNSITTFRMLCLSGVARMYCVSGGRALVAWDDHYQLTHPLGSLYAMDVDQDTIRV
jgi:hypothetical protein